MSRKSRPPSRTHAPTKRPVDTASSRICRPEQWRVVASRTIASATSARDTPTRRVPEIRISGAWLERIGFPSGTRYLPSAEREFRTLILQAVDED